MNAQTAVYKSQQGYIKNTILVLLAFATAFFPRIINSVGAPDPINFVHFAIVPLACGIVITKTRVKNRKQILITWSLTSALVILLGVMTASALLNGAGLINVFVAFMLLAEPFIMLIAIICIPFSLESLKQFRRWILGFMIIHISLALIQKILLETGILQRNRMTIEDNIQGVFYLTGGGHVVSAMVAMSFSLYYFFTAKNMPILIRSGFVFAGFLVLLFADAKQVLLVYLVAWAILILISVKDIKLTLQYVIAAVLIGYILFWCIENLEAFRAFKTWIRPEIYGPNGDATILKTSPFRIIPSYYKSLLNWFLGLGPGHTVGRLGGWMLRDYWNLLEPLGATIHPCSQAVWSVWRGSYLDSSFFSPLFGWAAIWGDSGFFGLAAYLYLALMVWRRICLDDFSKLMILTVMVKGLPKNKLFQEKQETGFLKNDNHFKGEKRGCSRQPLFSPSSMHEESIHLSSALKLNSVNKGCFVAK
ncbi:hypothetical protein H6G41_14420, partial [Tolypothrix sp. FACHB-123]|uniref:hypothetical protein n=1 Tax=Tolypothrix sp. FACHB-123 TaxID=2692868 RepID=UPI0016875C08